MNRENSHEHAENFVQTAVVDYQSPLTRYAARLVGDPDRARDIVQDTFVKLMAQPPAVVDGHLAEWLFTVCRHRALDVLRKEGRMKRFEEGEMERVTAEAPRPTRSLEAEETHDALLRMIDRLPPTQQEVLRLKFQSGFSYKEISSITTHSVSHVGVLIHHAVTRLRAEYATQRT
jgi:RNA polymerase sigma-70 factor (ECF subfamily)